MRRGGEEMGGNQGRVGDFGVDMVIFEKSPYNFIVYSPLEANFIFSLYFSKR